MLMIWWWCVWIILPECLTSFNFSHASSPGFLFSITINFRAINNTIIFRCVVKKGEARRRRSSKRVPSYLPNKKKAGLSHSRNLLTNIFLLLLAFFPLKLIDEWTNLRTNVERNPWELLACVHENSQKNVLIFLLSFLFFYRVCREDFEVSSVARSSGMFIAYDRHELQPNSMCLLFHSIYPFIYACLCTAFLVRAVHTLDCL